MVDISEDLIKKVQQGDMKAFEDVYRAMSGFVYNVSLGIANSREDAEEITQEVFLTVYRKVGDFRFESSFRTWLYRIAVNLALNRAKKGSHGKRQMIDYGDQIENAAVVDQRTHKDNGEAVEEMLGRLSPEHRACIVLRSIEGLSYEQIAQTLKININTVRSRLKRARQRLLTLREKQRHEQV